MPHHPCCGSKVEHSVSRKDITVENVLLFVLDEGAGGRVDYALRRASGAGGVEDVERVRRWKLGKFQRLGRKLSPRRVSPLTTLEKHA